MDRCDGQGGPSIRTSGRRWLGAGGQPGGPLRGRSMLHRGEGGCDGTDVLLHRCPLAALPLAPRRQSSMATTLCRGRSADSPSLGLHPQGHLASSFSCRWCLADGLCSAQHQRPRSSKAITMTGSKQRKR